MIATPCETCVLQNKKEGKCRKSLYQIEKDGHIIAPGICKYYRNKQWFEKNRHKISNTDDLSKIADQENTATKDIIILYDGDISKLQSTIDFIRYSQFKKIIISSKENNFDLHKKYIQKLWSDNLNVYYDICTENEITNRRIYRLSNIVKSHYFLVVDAGRKPVVTDRDYELNRSRCVLFMPTWINGNTMIDLIGHEGLYFTQFYKSANSPRIEELFYEQLHDIEKGLGFKLVNHSEKVYFI